MSLAAGYGVAGERVEKPEALADALPRGMAEQRPYLIAAEIDPAVPPLI